ncbi:winged helix-turn-helix transcriptional regulator [Methylobacterium pseudosasicola]|uniref:Transcriptional regulator, HxlR family n=1 Tax=Methylobacterium pseudosasicola TaxID=582667 RepID=A0A1I4NBG8_9HYPH|nr:helix-turn-helix domain-containing protein [Methylobacterium pseudosasicola]SFM12735.1 transcriptional regulator, HxlR family [Methylobacterium pseudosasicola]
MQDGTFLSPGHLQETCTGNANVRDCPTRQLLDLIGDKWSVLILLLLGREETRFSRLKQRIEGISQKMLSQTLRSLERDGLVTRHAVATVPVTVSYRIAPLGRELIAALQLMIDWAETRMSDVAEAQRAFDQRASGAATRFP